MQLNYKRSGQGPTVILIHGLFGSLENLGMVRRGLQTEFDVISVDLPDHGSSPTSEQFSFAHYANSVIQLMDELSLSSAHFLGHSLGGKIAMTIALHHPERVKKLIIADIAPVTYPPRHDAIFAGLNCVDLVRHTDRKQAETAMKQHIAEAGVRQFLLRSFVLDDGVPQWRFNLSLLQRDYPLLSEGLSHDTPFIGPTLFIKGENSDYITAKHRDKIHQLFPHAKARIIENTGHWLHAEKPDVFNRIAAQFLR